MESRGAEKSDNPIHRTLLPGMHRGRCNRLTTGLVLLAALGLQVAAWAGAAAATELISVNTRGVSGNGPSNGVSLSTNGSVAAFYSDATDLVPQDTNQSRDVFVRDRNAGTTERVSVSTDGLQADKPSQAFGMAPAISDNGAIVTFYSDATNLVANDANGATDVFVRDRQAGTTALVSVNMSGTSGNRPSLFPSISADGRLVAFQSAASDLVPGDTNSATDIFVRDLQAGTTERLCGVQPNGDSFSPAISGDGKVVAFVSFATNLVTNAKPGIRNIFVCDRTTGAIELISQSGAGVPADQQSMTPAINFDGRFVAFKSEATNLVPNDTNNLVDVFVRDRQEGTTERISVSFTGANSNDVSFPPAISDDGRFVVFGSAANNLVQHDANMAADVFVRDRLTETTVLAGLGDTGQQPAAGTPDVPPAISGDGTQIGFVSMASNLVLTDRNEMPDVFAVSNPLAPTAPTATPTPTITPTPILCIGTEDCPDGQLCVGGRCTAPTPAPTPLPCHDSSQCPSPLVCLDGICQPAQSPTPTVTPTPIPTCTTSDDCAKTCSTASDCHAGQNCESGECTPADRCVDGVCVPSRTCEETAPTACIESRETCLDGVCQCGGDCNLDGFVFGNEIAKMICIMSGNPDCPLSQCEAGDFNQDGQIKGNEICQAVTNLGVGCPLGIQDAAALAGVASAERTLTLMAPPTISPGQTMSLSVALGDSEGVTDVATAQLDVLFDARVFSLPNPNQDCIVDPRLTATDVAFTFLPRRPDTPDNFDRLRVFVADLAICNPNFTPMSNAFGSGPLVTCSFVVNPQAPLGQTTVSGERTNLGDVMGVEIPSSGTSANITVVEQTCTKDMDCPDGRLCRNGVCQPECTNDSQCADGTVCRTGACVPQCSQDSDCTGGLVCRNQFCVPTCTQDSDCSNDLVCKDGACVPACTQDTDCPFGSVCENGGCRTGCTTHTDCSAPARQACVMHTCLCGGDCGGGGIVDTAEILRMVSIFGGATPIDTCAAGDINGDGIITTNEILAAVFNFGAGCPGSGS